MFKTFIHWILSAKLWLYLAFNYRKFKASYISGDMETFYKIASKSYELYSDTMFRSSRMNFDVLGIENVDVDETYLIVSNHLGLADIAVIIKAFPKYFNFVCKKEISNIIVLSNWMRMCGCIFLDRDSVRNSINEINKGVNNLRNGISMCIFPEGTRSTTGEIGEFKKGSFKMSLKSGAKILPLVLVGTRSVYEDNNKKISKGDVKAIFLESIDVTKLSTDEINDLNNIVRNKINEVYKKFV